MSIAVSAVVQPSRILLVMVSTMSAIVLAIGASIGIGWIGDLPNVSRFFVDILSIFLEYFGFYHGVCHRKTIHIDISGVGQLRLTKVSAEGPCTDTNWPHVRKNGEVCHLLKDTTIWPHLLLLRLQAESGKITSLVILPDCVSKDSFRALSVACRWIAGQSNPKQVDKF